VDSRSRLHDCDARARPCASKAGDPYRTWVAEPETNDIGGLPGGPAAPLLIGTNAGFAALPNLTSPVFDLATVNGQPANLNTSEEIQLIDSNNRVIGTPSAPDPDTDGFNACTWATSCSAPSGS
jgi:hypothetical protein